MIDTMQNPADRSDSRKRMRALSMPDLMDLKDIQAFDEALEESSSSSCKTDANVPASSSAVSMSSLLSPSSSTADLFALVSNAMFNHHPLMRVFSRGLNRSMSLPRESSANDQVHYDQTSMGDSVSALHDLEVQAGDFYIPDDDISACSNDDTTSNFGHGSASSGYLPRFYSAEKLSTLIPPTSTVPSASPKCGDYQRQAQADDENKRSAPLHRSVSAGDCIREKSVQSSATETSSDVQYKVPLVPRDFIVKMRGRDAAMSNLEDFFSGKSNNEPHQSSHPSPQSVVAFHPSNGKDIKKRPLFSLSWFGKKEEAERVSESDRETIHIPHSLQMQSDLNRSGVAVGMSHRRSIFGSKSREPRTAKPPRPVATRDPNYSKEDRKSDGFVMISRNDRANSMPMRMPSSSNVLPYSSSSKSLLPRRSSLKKVSSLKNIAGKSNETSSTGGIKPNVSFSNLSIREYEVTLGDNPSCSEGPPISLGWEYRDTGTLPLEEFETTRQLHFPRRNSNQLMLSYNVRRYLLLKTAGYTKAELREAMKEVERIKRERKVTDMLMPACVLDEVMEDVVERVKSMFGKNNQGNTTTTRVE